MARKVQRIENNWNSYSTDVVAKPVDTYVTPERVPQESGYGKLATALAGIHAPLQKYAKDRFEERKAEEEAEGEKLYHESGAGLSWKDFKDANKLKEYSNFTKQGFLAARLSNEAALLSQSLKEAYDKGDASVQLPDGKTVNIAFSDDPTAFDAWMRRTVSAYIKENMGDDVPATLFSSVFVPQMNEYTKSLAKHHMDSRYKTLQLQYASELGGLAYNVITERIKEGKLALGSEDEIQDVVGQLNGLVSNAMANGLEPSKAAQAIEDALVGLAGSEEFENMDEVFFIINRLELSPNIKLGNLGEVRSRVSREARAAEQRREMREEKEKKKKKEADKEKIDAFFVEMLVLALTGKPPTKAMLLDGAKKLEGLMLGDVSDAVRQIETILNYGKPKEDNFGRAQAMTEYQAGNLLAYQRATGGVINPEHVYTVGRKQYKLTNTQVLSLITSAQNMNGPIGNVIHYADSEVTAVIQHIALAGKHPLTDPGAHAKSAAIRDKVEVEFVVRAEKDPRMLTNLNYGKKVMVDIAREISGKESKVPIRVYTGYVTGDSVANAAVQKRFALHYKFNGTADIRQVWSDMGTQYNADVTRGVKPENTRLWKRLQDEGLKLSDFEREMNIKLVTMPKSNGIFRTFPEKKKRK